MSAAAQVRAAMTGVGPWLRIGQILGARPRIATVSAYRIFEPGVPDVRNPQAGQGCVEVTDMAIRNGGGDPEIERLQE